MTTLSVGSLYHPARTRWPEGSQYTCRAGEHELLLLWPSPRAAEVRGVRSGAVEIAVLVEPPVIALCYRIADACDWSDAPYSIHLVPEPEREPPHQDALAAESRALLRVVLVDAMTGIVRAIRAVTLSPEVTRGLHEAIARQLVAPWDPSAYDAALASLYARHPHSRSMAAAASLRCRGGA